MVRAFIDAILVSNASSSKTHYLDERGIWRVLHALQQHQTDFAAIAEKETARGTDRASFESQRYLVRLPGHQITDQDLLLRTWVGRLHAMWEIFPVEELGSFPDVVVRQIRRVARQIPAIPGTTVTNLWLVHATIAKYYELRSTRVARVLPIIPGKSASKNAQNSAIKYFISRSFDLSLQNDPVIDSLELEEALRNTAPDGAVRAYLKLFGRSTEEARGVHTFRPGHFSRDFSPITLHSPRR